MELGSDDVDASIVWVRSWSSRCGWNIKIIIFIIFMKCDEIGRWFIDDVVWCERAVVSDAVWCVLSCWGYAVQDGCGSGEEANLICLWGKSGKKAMWPDVDVGYWIWSSISSIWRLPVKGRPCRIWNLMKSEARDVLIDGLHQCLICRAGFATDRDVVGWDLFLELEFSHWEFISGWMRVSWSWSPRIKCGIPAAGEIEKYIYSNM